MRIQRHFGQIISWINWGMEELENAFHQTAMSPLALKVNDVVNANKSLFFWSSAAVFLSAAPKLFLYGAAVGMAVGASNPAPLVERYVHTIDSSRLKNIGQTVTFIVLQCFHELLLSFINGCRAGYHLYHIFTGVTYGSGIVWLDAIQHELNRTAYELAQWFPFFDPEREETLLSPHMIKA